MTNTPGTALLAAREVALAQARTLARHGRYAEAEELLEGALRGAEPSVPALDLLARIHAQQGRLDQADRCWAEAERLAPGGAEITAGRRRIAALRDGRRRPIAGALVRRGGAVLVPVLVLALLVDIRFEQGGPQATVPPGPRPPGPASPPPSALPSPGGPGLTPGLRGIGLSGAELKVPGVRVRELPGEISVTFDRGLFRDGATLSARGEAVLGALGARLRPHAGEVAIAVIGHTDGRAIRPGGDYATNVELGTLRAAVVREVLRAAARIPTAGFSVSTLGGVLPPARGDGAAAQARNRTVSLRISAADEG